MSELEKFKHLIDITLGDEQKITKEMKAASGVIVVEGEHGERKVLIIKRSHGDSWEGMWEFPRGKCDKGPNEDTVHCVKREVKEETGLDVRVVRLIDTFEYLADNGTRRTISYNYLCVPTKTNQKVKLSKEHDGYKWITQLGEAELLLPPEQKKTLEVVLSKENPIVTYPENNFTKNNNIEENIMYNLIEMYLESIQEIEIEEISGKVDMFGDVILKMSKGEVAVGGVVAALAIIALAFKGVDYLATEKKCRATKPGSDLRRICNNEVLIENLKRKIEAIQSKSVLCNKSKNPTKCKKKISEKVQDLQYQISKRKLRIKQLKRDMR